MKFTNIKVQEIKQDGVEGKGPNTIGRSLVAEARTSDILNKLELLCNVIENQTASVEELTEMIKTQYRDDKWLGE